MSMGFLYDFLEMALEENYWRKSVIFNPSASITFLLSILFLNKSIKVVSLCVSIEETTDGGKEMVKGILEDVVKSAVKGSKIF